MSKPARAPYKKTMLWLAPCLSWCFIAVASASETPGIDPAHYDWVPASQLTPEQKQQLTHACSGAYIDPLAKDDANENPGEKPIDVEADKTNMESDKIVLDGNVTISQGSRRIVAKQMLYDRKTQRAELKGDIVIRQPGLLVRGKDGEVNMAGEDAKFEGGEFVLHKTHLRGGAGLIEHQAGGVIVLEDGTLTSCEPGHEAWVLNGEQLRLDTKSMQGSGKNVVLEVGGAPILYLPYITFPIGSQRQTGWLFPSIGSSNGGIDVTLPWYWNIAPNYDATIAPRYVSGHGGMLETEWRYLNHYSENSLALAALPDDKGGVPPNIDLPVGVNFRQYEGDDRWLTGLQHNSIGDSRWYSEVDFAKVSDVDYFKDLTPASFELANNTSLGQGAVLGYRFNHWNVSGRVQTYQNLLVDLAPNYQQLPRVKIDGHYSWDSVHLNLNHEWADFVNEDERFIQGQRANANYQLEWNKQWQWGFFRPSAGIQSLAYNLDETSIRVGANAQPNLTASYNTIDTGLIFERDGGHQTLEPRIFYVNRESVDHSELYQLADPLSMGPQDLNFDTTLQTFSYDQLFRGRRFVGGDRIGDANQLSVGITNQWLNEGRTHPLAALSLGQVIYFDDRQVTLTSNEQSQTIQESDLAGQALAQITEDIQLHSDFLYNPKIQRTMRGATGFSYSDPQNRQVKIAYRYVRPDQIEQATLPVDQLDTAFSVPVNDQWQLVGRVFYDLEADKELDTFFGFEYDDCCYRVRLLARRWLDSKFAELVNVDERRYDYGLFFEVDLKGLASSGKKIQRLLDESLPDFKQY